jgi:hypothetical protein
VILLFGLTTSALAAAIHAGYIRFMAPRAYFFCLFLIEALVITGVTVLFLITALPLSFTGWLVGVVLSLSLAFAYLLCFVGVAHDSPTLALVNAILDFGAEGMPVEKIPAFIVRHPFVAARLKAVHEAGFIKSAGGRVVLGPKTAGLLQLALYYKRLAGGGRASG